MHIILYHILIFFNIIVNNQIMKEKENFRLNLRKIKINSILSSKRQIDFSNNDDNEKYHITLQDIQLNPSLFINEDKLFSSVTTNISYIISFKIL